MYNPNRSWQSTNTPPQDLTRKPSKSMNKVWVPPSSSSSSTSSLHAHETTQQQQTEPKLPIEREMVQRQRNHELNYRNNVMRMQQKGSRNRVWTPAIEQQTIVPYKRPYSHIAQYKTNRSRIPIHSKNKSLFVDDGEQTLIKKGSTIIRVGAPKIIKDTHRQRISKQIGIKVYRHTRRLS